ncbi:MAG: methylenetetrahydrofolate reductase [Jatrophihabitans sp.]|uniref:methylenetetrahydrofolate reductase n=1 Tax=Jatrophihabitans sp. TaxID=1932789 RepID=UPI0039136ED8
MSLIDRIADGSGEFLLFALTPPRSSSTGDRAQEIADATLARLLPLDLDGLILYDIADEAARNPAQRPFPFMPTMDPAAFLADNLASWRAPVVVYRAVGKYSTAELGAWCEGQDPSRVMAVLVGAASRDSRPKTSLKQAQALIREANPALLLGGVAIPERHAQRGDEIVRLLAKQDGGTRFFVTQVVYDTNAAKNLVSDYHYACVERATVAAPVVFTFSVCGSIRTLEFLNWLGVGVPRWIENDLRHATDTLEASYQLALANAVDLIAYCRALGVPFGINVESVSSRRVEIEAAVRLAERLGVEVRR